MGTHQACERCGATLTAITSTGLCPTCLLAAGLGVAGEDAAPTGSSAPADAPTAEPGRVRPSGPAADPAAATPPSHIGAYKLLRQIGEGGMGTVWMAEQTAYLDIGRQHEAVALYEETFQLRRATLGLNHRDPLVSMNGLAAAYWKTSRRDEAQALLEQTVERQTIVLGPDDRETLVSMHALGVICQESGRHEEAIRLFQATLRRRQTVFGPAHSDTIVSMSWLGRAYMASDRFTEAEPVWQVLAEVLRPLANTESRDLGNVLVMLGECRLQRKQFVAAEPVLREALPIYENNEPDRSSMFQVHGLLGWALLGQSKFPEAESQLLRAFQGLERREAQRPSPSRGQLLKETGERIMELYATWGKPQQAAEWKRRVSEPRNRPAVVRE